MSVLILTEQEIRACVSINHDALKQVESAFDWLASGLVSMPPVMHIEVDHQSDVDIKGAYVRGQDAFAVKMASGFFGNTVSGLPSASGMVVMMSAETGFCQCVFLDNGYLTDLRTGLAGAVCAQHLAPKEVRTVGVVGAGGQARFQIESLRLVRDFERLLVHGRSDANVETYITDMAQRLGVEVIRAESLEQLVAESQVVVTTTQSKEALICAEWLHPGLHVTAMGSDLPGKQELEPQVLVRADLLVCDSRSQCAVGGELQHALSAGILNEPNDIVELGDVTSGKFPGRTDESQITVSDLTGTGVQDTAIALEAYRKALEQNMGTSIEGR
jgi:ectoine utilization protein EutC